MAAEKHDPILDKWVKKAESVLLNRKIVKVRYMLDSEQ